MFYLFYCVILSHPLLGQTLVQYTSSALVSFGVFLSCSLNRVEFVRLGFMFAAEQLKFVGANIKNVRQSGTEIEIDVVTVAAAVATPPFASKVAT